MHISVLNALLKAYSFMLSTAYPISSLFYVNITATLNWGKERQRDTT
jgi:hypothetical protein